MHPQADQTQLIATNHTTRKHHCKFLTRYTNNIKQPIDLWKGKKKTEREFRNTIFKTRTKNQYKMV